MGLAELRHHRGWSQEQLAEISQLSVRTIQRIEKGTTPGTETRLALAAAFDMAVDELDIALASSPGRDDGNRDPAQEARESAIRGFEQHLLRYLLICSALLVLNLVMSTDYVWAKWVFLGWGISVLLHGIRVVRRFGAFVPWARPLRRCGNPRV